MARISVRRTYRRRGSNAIRPGNANLLRQARNPQFDEMVTFSPPNRQSGKRWFRVLAVTDTLVSFREMSGRNSTTREGSRVQVETRERFQQIYSFQPPTTSGAGSQMG